MSIPKTENHFLNVARIKHLLFETRDKNFLILDAGLQKLGFEFPACRSVFMIDDPEKQKNFLTLEKITNQFLRDSISKTDRIISIGGGAIGDLSGFTASILLRGIPWISVPTTFLSMIDSSVGGKTSINHELGKNLLGSFYWPLERWICLDFLRTLPQSLLQEQLGELVKTALFHPNIRDQILRGRKPEDLILDCIEFKENIVALDPFDQRERKTLNFGHTLGHALEIFHQLSHGRAILNGLGLEIRILGLPLLETKFQALVGALGLDKLLLPNFGVSDSTEFWDLVSVDKKRFHLQFPISYFDEEEKFQEVYFTLEELRKRSLKAKAL